MKNFFPFFFDCFYCLFCLIFGRLRPSLHLQALSWASTSLLACFLCLCLFFLPYLPSLLLLLLTFLPHEPVQHVHWRIEHLSTRTHLTTKFNFFPCCLHLFLFSRASYRSDCKRLSTSCCEVLHYWDREMTSRFSGLRLALMFLLAYSTNRKLRCHRQLINIWLQLLQVVPLVRRPPATTWCRICHFIFSSNEGYIVLVS